MNSLPAIDRALLPAAVRNGDASQRQQYGSALAFEAMLLEQMLTSAMSDSAHKDGSNNSGNSVSNHYSRMLPELMARSVTEAGGVGLARQIYDGMQTTTEGAAK